jgi:oligopeptidase A
MTNPLSDKLILTTGRIDYADIKPEHFKEMFDFLLVEAQKEHERDMDNTNRTYSEMFEDKCSNAKHLDLLYQIMHSFTVLNDSDELRKVYDQYSQKIDNFYYQVHQADPRLFESIKNYINSDEYKTLQPLQKKVVDDIYDSYVRSGAELPLKKKEKIKKLSDKLNDLTTTFGRNIIDHESQYEWFFEDMSKLSGLSTDSLSIAKNLAKNKGKDGYLFTMSDGNASDLLQYADDEKIRKDYYLCDMDVVTKGKYSNKRIIKKIVKIKSQIAKIQGYSTYTNKALEKMMVKEPESVLKFLDDLGIASIESAKKESERVIEYGLARLDRKPEFWDYSYIGTKAKKELYNVDPIKVQEYLKLDTVKNGLFSTIKDLFNVEFKDAVASKSASESEKWHPDVEIFDVFENGKYIGTLNLDLFKRPMKRGGAWMSPVKTYHRYEDGFEELAIGSVICNFVKVGEGEVQTISMYDVETLFHEFGHALHHLLSKVKKSSLGGIHVEWDAVELPSQFMENFCWDWKYFENMTSHKATGEKIPKDMFDKMVASKNHNAGIAMIRQVSMSEFDMRSYNQKGIIRSPLVFEKATSKKWKYRKYNKKMLISPSFSHIFDGGYSSLYYSYLWAEVLSSDVYEAVQKDSTLVKRFKEEILETGGVDDMMDKFKALMGREPNVNALIKSRGLK